MSKKEEYVPNILKEQEAYVFDYPEANEFADKQCRIFWTHEEIDLTKDVQDILVNLTEAERHGVLTVLKLFTKYELIVGNEYWTNIVHANFKRPEIQRMANCFAFFEENVHAPFYNKINKLLHLDTEEFYTQYLENETLKSRVKFLEEKANPKNLPLAIGTFAMQEGAILYANFAFLKHFQANGKNKMRNLVSGIDFSERDEGSLHHLGGAWLFNTLVRESRFSPEEQLELNNQLYSVADTLREHEHCICDMIFEKGRIEGITSHQLKNFVDSRLDICLQNLGLQARYNPSSNPIAEWFYLGASQTKTHDFFVSVGNQYHRAWTEEKFEW